MCFYFFFCSIFSMFVTMKCIIIIVLINSIHMNDARNHEVSLLDNKFNIHRHTIMAIIDKMVVIDGTCSIYSQLIYLYVMIYGLHLYL